MQMTKVFMNGESQAVRLPKDYRFDIKEVFIKRIGDMVLLVPKKKVWSVFLEGLHGFSDDFCRDRLNPSPKNSRGLEGVPFVN